MRHQRKTVKLGRKEGHRKSLLANLAVSLIEHHRIKTTLAKAKALRPLAEKLVTIGKKNTLHARRTAKAVLRQDEAVTKLFAEIAPRAADRKGGYTRIIKLVQRKSDAAEVALIEWTDAAALVETATPAAQPAKKTAKSKSSEPAPESASGAEGEKPARKPRAKKPADDKSTE